MNENRNRILVEIQNIRKADGSGLPLDDWRRDVAGTVSAMTIVNDGDRACLCFEMAIYVSDNEGGYSVDYIDLDGYLGTTFGIGPVEISPDIFELYTEDGFVCRYRVLAPDEATVVGEEICAAIEEFFEENLPDDSEVRARYMVR